MDAGRLRAWWAHRQGLDGSLLGKSPAEVLERAGWARSVAGTNPYLTFFSRARLSRESVDEDVAKTRIHELPAARGCTYIVPASDYALALVVACGVGDPEMKAAEKPRVAAKELDKLCDAVVSALAKGPLDPEGIREATGSASRSLGEAGKKKGLTTTLPIALGRLQIGGHIRRIPTNGRLDQQRYRYALWKPNPLANKKLSLGDAHVALARKDFRWVGPATLTELQWFTGLGVKATQDIVGSMDLVPADAGSDRLLLSEDVEAFRKFKAPTKAHFSLVSSLDSLFAARRNVKTLLDPHDFGREVVTDRETATVGGLADLPSHAIVDRGRLVGLWEYDCDTRTIAWTSFGVTDRALEKALRETEVFVRGQLGDARSFSLDSPRSRAPRIAALRAM